MVVTFNPDCRPLTGLLEDLAAEGLPTVLVDNGSDQAAHVAEIAAPKKAVKIIAKPQNIGLGAGLNQGIAAAAEYGYRSVLLLDQDSRLEPGFHEGIKAARIEAEQLQRPISAIGPTLQDPITKRQQPFKCVDRFFHRRSQRIEGTKGLYAADFLITSGSLISLDALADIGQMREDYFIDNIDLEWCFRARAKGYRAYGTDHCLLQHRIGETHANPLVKHGLITMHGPARAYYTTRNRFHLYRQPYAGWLWKCRDFPRFLVKSAYLLIVSKQRRAYARNLWAGWRDRRLLKD